MKSACITFTVAQAPNHPKNVTIIALLNDSEAIGRGTNLLKKAREATSYPSQEIELFTFPNGDDQFLAIAKVVNKLDTGKVTLLNQNEFRIISATNKQEAGTDYAEIIWAGGSPPFATDLVYQKPDAQFIPISTSQYANIDISATASIVETTLRPSSGTVTVSHCTSISSE